MASAGFTSDDGRVVSVASAQAATAREAALAIRAGIAPEPLAALLVFFSAHYDAQELAAELNRLFPGVQIAGCSTAGELSPEGLSDGSVVALGFPSADFTIVAQPVLNLSGFGVEHGRRVVQDLRGRLAALVPGAAPGTVFALLLIDGMCRREEAVISAIYASLDEVPLVGGSAGDNLHFERASIIAGGAARTDAAALVLVHTTLPFRTFKSDHFAPTDTKMVVTEADTELRIVKELNAEPAAEEYARMVGVTGGELDPFAFAAHPVVVRVGGRHYARSIQRVNSDGSLSFFCAIDEGMVLTAAQPRDILESLNDTFAEVEAEIGVPDVYVAFDCVLRRLDAQQRQLTQQLSGLYRKHRVIGFNSYGEQYRSMHLNQTLTGVAIGRRAVPPDDGESS